MNHTQKIRELLAMKQLDAAALGRLAGIPGQRANRFAKHKTQAIGDAMRIADALGVPLRWLIDDSLDMPPPQDEGPLLGESPESMATLLRMLAKSLGIAADKLLESDLSKQDLGEKGPHRRQRQ